MHHLSVDGHSPGGNERRGIAATGVGDERNDAVESLAGERGRDLLVDHPGVSGDGRA
jgi:hypothetical protein